MRITNNTLRMAFLGALEQAQQRILKTQTQVSTGLRVNQPSDDPFAAARIGELGAALTKLDQYQTNADAARHRLGLEEEALVALGNDLQRVRELTVQGNSDSLGNADRAAIAAELRQRLESLIGVANASDAAGNYLFAGYRETTLPFLSTPSGIVYAGDSGQRLVQISDNRFVAVNDSGEKVFQRIPSGNGTFVLAAASGNTGTGVLGRGSVSDPAAYVADSYSIDFLTPTDYEIHDGGGGVVATGTYAEGQAIAFGGVNIELSGAPAAGDGFSVTPSSSHDLFTTVQNLIDAFETPVALGTQSAQLHNRVGQSLADLDQDLEHVIDVRADIGARLQSIDQEASLVDGFSSQVTQTLSGLRDLDYAAALSLLTQQLTGLDAAQQTFVRTQSLSLFRFL